MYHKLGSCNNCKSENTVVTPTQTDGGYISEAKVYCEDCKFGDYWAYGFYESGKDMESKCEQYE